MSWSPEHVTEPIARRDYMCDACDWVIEYIGEGIFSFKEYRLIVKIKRNGWKIKAGQKYLKLTGKYEGEWSVFRAIPEMNQLCLDHDLYQQY
jgi:hypothetical protein